jgi:hypothetical protein
MHGIAKSLLSSLAGLGAWHRHILSGSISCPERNGGFQQVCRKCAVHFDPMCAKALLFNTRADCFRAGLIVGKLLNHNGDKTRQTLSDSPTLNQ